MNGTEKYQNDLEEISWTTEELQKWVEAKLIPQHLLEPANHAELQDYLRNNKKRLFEHYHRNLDTDLYQVQIPPSNERDKAQDFHIIDKRTGEVVRTLDMAANFMLCEGVHSESQSKRIG